MVVVQAVEIIPGRLYMVALRTSDGLQRSGIASGSITYCIDSELVRSSAIFTAVSMAEPPLHERLTGVAQFPTLQVYEPFYADFGPLNLGLTYRFCQKTQTNLQVLQIPRAGPSNAVFWHGIH